MHPASSAGKRTGTGTARTRHVCEAEGGRRLAAAEDVEGAGDALQAQHVVAVGWNINLIDDLLAGGADGGVHRPRRRRLQLLAEHLLLAGLHTYRQSGGYNFQQAAIKTLRASCHCWG